MQQTLRAIQASYFQHGYNLRISRDKLLQRVAQARSQRLTKGDFTALRAYREPHRAALCVLHDAGYPIDDLNRVTISDVVTALNTDTLHGVTLHPDARPFLRAALLHRARDGATPSDPLIALSAHSVGRTLSRAAIDIGLFVGNPYSGSNRHTLSFWQYRDGFHCERIPT